MVAENTSSFGPAATAQYRQNVEAAATSLAEQVGPVPETGLLLGREGRALLDEVDAVAVCEYTDLPHFPSESDRTDEGTITVGTLNGTSVVVLSGPLLIHEGHTPHQVAFPIRMLAVAGVDTLILSGRAGGLRSELAPGDLMVVTNHINFQGLNPLVGTNVDEWGPRFPDMTDPYAPAVNRAAGTVARRDGIPLRRGVLLAVSGPSLGTGAEYRMMRTLGADAVGTGLVPEVITARHMGLRVGAVTVIADQCSPDVRAPVAVDDANEAIEGARAPLCSLLKGLVAASEIEGEPT